MLWLSCVSAKPGLRGSDAVGGPGCAHGSRVSAQDAEVNSFSSCAAAGKSPGGLGRTSSRPGRCPRARGGRGGPGARRGADVLRVNKRHLRLTGSPASHRPSGALLRTLMIDLCFARSRLQLREGVSRAEEPSRLLGHANETQGPLRHGKSLLELSDNALG